MCERETEREREGETEREKEIIYYRYITGWRVSLIRPVIKAGCAAGG